MRTPFLTLSAVCFMMTLAACSGGGKNNKPIQNNTAKDGSSPNNRLAAPTWTPGVFADPLEFYQKCQTARSGNDPFTNEPFEDLWGTAMHEKMFLRSLTNELYLWYDEVPDNNPQSYSVADYFETLKVERDRFHYTDSYENYFRFAEGGTRLDYGVTWTFDFNNFVIRAGYVETDSPNADAIQRGDRVIAINGLRFDALLDESEYNQFSEWLLTPSANTYTFTLQNLNGQQRDVVLTALEKSYSAAPVAKTLDTTDGKVGYILFNTHDATAESALTAAVTGLAAQNVQDLVVDLRYNLGGALDVASQLGYMIAGATRTQGKAFERLAYNDRYGYTDPFSGESDPTPFLSTSTNSTPLPTLNLDRVFVLTSADTCSASEALMNGLNGIGVEVIQIGSTTCGKPYGFYPIENCGTVYYTVMFKGENHAGFGDYDEGFKPANNQTPTDDVLPGCFAVESFNGPLGDTQETLLETALNYRANGTCPDVATSTLAAFALRDLVVGPDSPLIRRPHAITAKRALHRLYNRQAPVQF